MIEQLIQGIKEDWAIVGGNCDNDLHVGVLYSNVNNLPSNANWNIGAALSYLLSIKNYCSFVSLPLGRNNTDKMVDWQLCRRSIRQQERIK